MDDKAKSRQYFNKHSSTGLNRNGYWSRDYKATAEVLLAHSVTNHIDIGCGNGAFLAYLHKRAPEIQIHGLDYSAEMVRRSRERLPVRILRKETRKTCRCPTVLLTGSAAI